MTLPYHRTPLDRLNRLWRLRRGLVLALLALISQSVITLLPMPAMAASDDRFALCLSGHDQGNPASDGQTNPHLAPDCTLCQAGHLAASLLPPTPISLVTRVVPHWRIVAHSARAPPDRSFHPQQARAPPAFV